MKKILTLIITLTVLLSSLSVLSCSGDRLYREGEGELNVVCTIFPPFDFARNVGGEKITLTILQDNGADLHNYSPTSATLLALSQADVFICVGGESDEKWIDDAITAANNPDLRIVKLVSCIDELLHAELSNDWSGHTHEEEHDHEHEEGDEHHHEGDEHVWTSPKNAIKIVKNIAEAFCAADQANSTYYTENSSKYIAELETLDAAYASAADNAAHPLVVFADRFPFVYMMHDYGIAYEAAFSGCSTEVNASFETQTSLTETVKNNGLPAVLAIDGSDASLAETVSTAAGCQIVKMNSLQSVKRGEIVAGTTYLEVMRKNLEALKTVLG